jgi:hypothetical protein
LLAPVTSARLPFNFKSIDVLPGQQPLRRFVRIKPRRTSNDQ